MQDALVCKNCGNQFSGKFCNECGEKVYTERDKTFKHFIGEAFHFLTHFDSKFLRSWWLVMTKPGFVSSQIADGIRKPYYKPFNIFLVGVILYLLFPVFVGLNIPMKYHMSTDYGELADHMITVKMNARHLTLDQLAAKFDAKSPKFAKLLLLIVIPMCAFVLQSLFRRRRRYYFDHLTLASEINTFFLFFVFFILPLIITIVLLLSQLFGSKGMLHAGDAIIEPIYLGSMAIYSGAACRRFYREKWVWIILKTALFLIAQWAIVYIIYRLILFCLVLLFI